MPGSWLSLGELLKRRTMQEAEELTRREAVLEAMEADPADRRGPKRDDPDPSEFEDHGEADAWRRADA